MKTLRKMTMMVSVMLMSAAAFISCDNDDDDYSIYYPNALVTAKTSSDNVFFLQLDERTTLLPVNYKQSPFGSKEVRALVNYDEVNESAAPYDKAVRINWIDSILTKNTVPNRFQDNDLVYGKDPVEIVNDWVTVAEDGYLTLRFRTYWGSLMRPHTVNLLVNQKGGNPYEIEFRHNSNGDNGNRVGDGLVAFSLKDLPDTKGETVKVTLKWQSFRGMRSTTFDYCTRKETKGNLVQAHERNFMKAID